eukprot:TRINITY_DN87629_c0_g1_i1.p1 TRINITY_DN87629_c0_g1~~TRINITY_DN87629_c0_g1_i1.p1  ORF type:complete len:270 (-),score=47.96 TRINITY_DN87629_c0_g1_i1:322-1107(-)
MQKLQTQIKTLAGSKTGSAFVSTISGVTDEIQRCADNVQFVREITPKVLTMLESVTSFADTARTQLGEQYQANVGVLHEKYNDLKELATQTPLPSLAQLQEAVSEVLFTILDIGEILGEDSHKALTFVTLNVKNSKPAMVAKEVLQHPQQSAKDASVFLSANAQRAFKEPKVVYEEITTTAKNTVTSTVSTVRSLDDTTAAFCDKMTTTYETRNLAVFFFMLWLGLVVLAMDLVKSYGKTLVRQLRPHTHTRASPMPTKTE